MSRVANTPDVSAPVSSDGSRVNRPALAAALAVGHVIGILPICFLIDGPRLTPLVPLVVIALTLLIAVIRPATFRPPLDFFEERRPFSGSALVISTKSATVRNRRPAEVGFLLLIAISNSEKVDRVTLSQSDEGALGPGSAPQGATGPLPLAGSVLCIHG